MRISFCSFSVLLFLSLIPVGFAHAQTSCGSIIAPANWDTGYVEPGAVLQTQLVTDCSSPFGILKNIISPNSLEMKSFPVDNNSTIVIDTDRTKEYKILYNLSNPNIYYLSALFRHEGGNYQYVSLEPVAPTEQEYRTMAVEIFNNQTDIDINVARIMTNDPWEGLEYGSPEYLAIDTFYDYVENNFNTNPYIALGTYTLVFKEQIQSGGVGLYQKVLKHLASLFMPVVYAQAPLEPNTYTITFTVANLVAEPTGASSVLFLPGIQSSVLSKNGVLGTDDQIWLPDAGNQDVQQLAMNTDGASVNDVHTTGIISTLPFGGSVYDSFARFMVGLVHDGVIKAWTPFAYDWRSSVVDVAENGTKYEEGIRSAIDEIKYLASSSYSGKVTIIGHSNGGLLAKALMIRLEAEGKSNLVDKVVFLATPQLGTPKAIGTILHGYDQEKVGGWLIDDAVARDVIQNMPGAYGLIPSQKYFDMGTGPVVTFDTGAATQRFRNAYGTSIDSEVKLSQFMTGSADQRPDAVTIDNVLKANSLLLSTASEDHGLKLDSWVAPLGVEVMEVVGVGLDTVKSFEYQSFTEKFCTLLVLCHTEVVYKPVPHFSQYGDKTVMGQSAEAYIGEKKKYFVDLKRIADLDKPNLVEHYNISENPSVQTLIQNILEDATSTSNQFIATSTMQYSDDRILLGTHSPVTIEVTDQNGKQVKLTGDHVTEDIPGSSYTEIGDSKYVLVPANGMYTVAIKGTGNGGLTFSMDTLHGETQTKVHSVRIATITPSTSVQVAYASQTLSNLIVDTNGDGETDIVLTPNGADVTPKITYLTLKTAVDNLSLSKVRKLPLQVLVAAADVLDKKAVTNPKLAPLELAALRELESLLLTYQKKGWITQSEYSAIIKITNKLK